VLDLPDAAETMMRFIDVSVPKLGDDATKNEPNVRPVRERRLSFRPQPVEEYILDDTRSLRSVKTAETDERDDSSSVTGDKGDQFYEARDDTTEVSCCLESQTNRQSQRLALRQITFEFSFSVGKLQASLYKSTSPTKEKALADAVLEGFGLTFALRKYDMSVDLFLRNVTLAMIEQGQLRRPLLSSADTTESDVKLVRVKYMRVQKESPEYMTKHEGVDQSVDTELSTFKITVAPEPILSLYDFIMTTFVPHDEQAESAPATDVKPEEEEAPKSATRLKVRVKVTSAEGKLRRRRC
jgi:vacuolar protein sorting-associated protein 13A/C